jgi:hypothetical protein
MLLYQQRQNNLTQKEQYNQQLTNLTRYYESTGVQVTNNPWCSSYIQHLALYNHMYSNYIQSMMMIRPGTIDQAAELLENNNLTTHSEMPHQEDHHPQAAAAVPPPPRPANNDGVGEREDDWLSMLHNIVSFLILFSIIYFYSSLERFMLIVTIVFVLIMYHNGWLSLQRRQPAANARNVTPPPPAHVEAQDENTPVVDDEQPGQNQSPNILRLTVTFFLTFFTSLIPERPRIVN